MIGRGFINSRLFHEPLTTERLTTKAKTLAYISRFLVYSKGSEIIERDSFRYEILIIALVL